MNGESATRTCNSRTSWLGRGFPDRAERALVTALTPHRVAVCKRGSRHHERYSSRTYSRGGRREAWNDERHMVWNLCCGERC